LAAVTLQSLQLTPTVRVAEIDPPVAAAVAPLLLLRPLLLLLSAAIDPPSLHLHTLLHWHTG